VGLSARQLSHFARVLDSLAGIGAMREQLEQFGFVVGHVRQRLIGVEVAV